MYDKFGRKITYLLECTFCKRKVLCKSGDFKLRHFFCMACLIKKYHKLPAIHLTWERTYIVSGNTCECDFCNNAGDRTACWALKKIDELKAEIALFHIESDANDIKSLSTKMLGGFSDPDIKLGTST